ncbi:MAG: DUF2249 domain-containing protein [Candidatus Limnocylindrales bacterium]
MVIDNEQAAAAIVAHHAQLQATLHDRVGALVAAARVGADTTPPRVALLAFLDGELMPHARAEEGTLYRVPVDSPVAMLVAAMIAEHVVIGRRVAELATTSGAVDAAAQASAIEALFEVHLEKENERLLPFLVADPATRLAERLEGMHELLGEPDEMAEPAKLAEPPTIDVREIAHADRHPRIFATFESLELGTSLILVADHDPVHLRQQFAARWTGQFSWEYLEQGPDVWRIEIGRMAGPLVGNTASA